MNKEPTKSYGFRDRKSSGYKDNCFNVAFIFVIMVILLGLFFHWWAS